MLPCRLEPRAVLAAILAVVLMCCAAIPASGDPYNVNLANKDIYWGSVLSDDRLPFVEGKGIVSSGPYLIDVNHRESALLIGPLVVWVNGLMPKADQKQTPLDKVDLRGTKVRIAVRLEHAPWRNEFDPRIGGKLVFWFQSSLRRGAIPGGDYEMPWRTANYAYNREISLTSGEPVEIDVKPDLNQWTCLGRNPIDTRPLIGSAAKYTCALNQEEFAQAMSKPENMGVLFLLPSKTPDGTNLAWLNAFAPYRTPIMGNTSFILREFVIQRDDSRPAAGDF